LRFDFADWRTVCTQRLVQSDAGFVAQGGFAGLVNGVCAFGGVVKRSALRQVTQDVQQVVAPAVVGAAVAFDQSATLGQ
jgi:hypothetical protein